ncbi:MAG: hypothetical protein IAI50_10535 [Candidatus Eremiobacteraeota bacterium]|nr:hypothetical protein [Candidatus Eremiobacteraeota bacterium]
MATALGAGANTMAPGSMSGSMSGSMMGGMHGFQFGKAGPDGVPYTGKPNLQDAISLVTAGGAPGHFSITTAIASLAGPAVAKAEVAKLTNQYGASKVAHFVTVQNFAVNDAVKIALAAGVKFPSPMLHGKKLAVAVTTVGLEDGTYYEGPMLDHLVTHAIHERVMSDIDAKYGTALDANYHRIADQAHYDLAQALGATSVGLAAYH